MAAATAREVRWRCDGAHAGLVDRPVVRDDDVLGEPAGLRVQRQQHRDLAPHLVSLNPGAHRLDHPCRSAGGGFFWGGGGTKAVGGGGVGVERPSGQKHLSGQQHLPQKCVGERERAACYSESLRDILKRRSVRQSASRCGGTPCIEANATSTEPTAARPREGRGGKGQGGRWVGRCGSLTRHLTAHMVTAILVRAEELPTLGRRHSRHARPDRHLDLASLLLARQPQPRGTHRGHDQRGAIGGGARVEGKGRRQQRV